MKNESKLTRKDKIFEYIKENPDELNEILATKLDTTVGTITTYKAEMRRKGLIPEFDTRKRRKPNETFAAPSLSSTEKKTATEEEIKEKFKSLFSKKDVHTLEDLSNLFDVGMSKIRAVVSSLQNDGYNYQIKEDKYVIFSKLIEKSEASILHTPKSSDGFYRFGAVSDNHLCSRYERRDVLDKTYDIFKEEGIQIVYNGGNWIDGEARFNKHDLLVHGIDHQVDYFVKHYPQREGIVTKYISGDDHEGWYSAQFGINIGAYAEKKAREAGRIDLEFLGHMEADVILPAPEGQTRLRVLHPGGGSCFNEDAQILTKDRGWQFFKDLTLEDHVATMTKEGHVFQWQKPTHITNEQYNGDMLHFKARCFDFHVTPNHGLWVRRQRNLKGRRKEYSHPTKSHPRIDTNWHRADALDLYTDFSRQGICFPTVCEDWKGTYIPFVSVPRQEPMVATNKRNQEQMQHVGKQSMEDMAELIAWYVTEGYADRKRVAICQCSKVNPENHKQILDLLDRMKLRYTLSGRNKKDICIGSVELSAYLKAECGHLSRGKFLPAWLKDQPKKVLKIVFETMIKGDGWQNGASVGYKSFSKRLREDMTEIAQKLGYGNTENKESLSIRMVQNEPTINTKPKKYSYKGKIYCCSVPNELIYVRSNNKAFWSHNSYAVSYTAQKIVESYTGGEKPDILLIGHYHKAEFSYIRGVHAVQLGCQMDQSPFMRKKRLAAHLGGWIIEFQVDNKGAVVRFKQEWIPFYDKAYYAQENWSYKW